MSDTPDIPDYLPLTDTDRTFLRAIADIPEDRTTWLVYADWLDDRSDPRAEFLRLVVARDQMAEGDPATAAADKRIAELRIELDPRWMAAFDPAPIITGCSNSWTSGTCGSVWTELAPTDAPDIRICRVCRRPAFYGHTAEEAEIIGSLGEIVALSTRVPPEQNPFPAPPPPLDADSGEFDLNFELSLPLPAPVPVAPPTPTTPSRPWWKFW